VHPSLLPRTRHMPRPSHSSRFNHPHNIGQTFNNIQLNSHIRNLTDNLTVDISSPLGRYVLSKRSIYRQFPRKGMSLTPQLQTEYDYTT
jgi:hypothetical protein